MCKVHNAVGCLTTIKNHLKRHNISGFNSLNELISFQKNYSTLRQEIVVDHTKRIQEEKGRLATEISQLEDTIKLERAHFEASFGREIENAREKLISLTSSSGLNFIKRVMTYTRRRTCKKNLQALESNFDHDVNHAISELVGQHQYKANRYNYITLNFSDAVNESCRDSIKELEYKQRVIDEINNSIYGALGEHKVVKELENLTDEHVLINDFTLNFRPAIYNRQEHDRIKSIQIDHLLVTPAGLFIIETKNWSEKSVANLDLRSPVQQVKRTNFALFKILTDHISSGRLRLPHHHWGDRRIPIRNLIVLTNSKPNDEFQYVKVLSLNELLNYIQYFKPIFSNAETQTISNHLLNLQG